MSQYSAVTAPLKPNEAETIHQSRPSDHPASGWTLYCWSQSNATPQSAVPLMVHGLGGCIAWMEDFAKELLNEFDLVFGQDLHAYGPNPTGVGWIPSYHHLYESVADAVRLVHERTQRPVLLMGLSLGGLVVTQALAKTAHLPIQGVVLLSPAFKASSKSFQPMVYARVFQRYLVERFGRANPQMIGLPYEISQITSQVHHQQKVKQTVDCVRVMSASSYLELLKMTRDRRGFNQIDQSVLVMLTDQDVICDTEAMKTVYASFPSKTKQLVMFSGVRHDLMLEPILPSIVKHIQAWRALSDPFQYQTH